MHSIVIFVKQKSGCTVHCTVFTKVDVHVQHLQKRDIMFTKGDVQFTKESLHGKKIPDQN
jgi:hypothetical protein